MCALIRELPMPIRLSVDTYPPRVPSPSAGDFPCVLVSHAC